MDLMQGLGDLGQNDHEGFEVSLPTIPTSAKQFATDSFKSDEYIRSVLGQTSAVDQLKNQRTTLLKSSRHLISELKESVYRNYPLFIQTSQQIGRLESEVNELRGLMTAGQNAMQGLMAFSSSTGVGADGRTLNSGIMGVNVEKHSDMLDNALGEMDLDMTLVEDLQLFSRRHKGTPHYLLLDDVFEEFDLETYEKKSHVRLLLSNLCLFIASSSRRRDPMDTSKKKGSMTDLSAASSQSEWYLERYLELGGLAVINVKNNEQTRNAIQILKFPQNLLVQARNEMIKAQWMEGFNMTEQILKQQRQAAETKSESRGSDDTSGILDESMDYAMMMDETINTAIQTGNIEELNAEWLRDMPDDLDTYIAQRDFHLAVRLIQKTRAYLENLNVQDSAVDQMHRVVNNREKSLIDRIIEDLKKPQIGLDMLHQRTMLLIELNKSHMAGMLFLNNRSENLRRQFRTVKVEGSIDSYVIKFARIFFTNIKQTAEEMMEIFNDRKSRSSFMVWTMHEMEKFIEMISAQLFSGVSVDIVSECVDIISTHCDRLRQIGIDVRFVLARMLAQEVTEMIEKDYNRIKMQIRAALDNEDWILQRTRQIDDEDEPMTKSGVVVSQACYRYILNCIKVMGYVPKRLVVKNVVELVEMYLDVTLKVSKTLTDEGQYGAITTCTSIVQGFTSRAIQTLESAGYDVEPLQIAQKKLQEDIDTDFEVEV
eukprot:Clim_evm22s39 gene=Clim_evmTU22s39